MCSVSHFSYVSPLHGQQMTDEAILIEKARQGDRRAFKDIYELHVDALFRFMRQYSRDVSQVEDWVQRAFIKAYRNMSAFKGSSRFATWLFTIALNEMKTDLRRKSVVVFNSDDLKNVDVSDDQTGFEWEETMRVWFGEMDETKRAVFVLYEVEGYSHSEIAVMLNIAESSSRTLLSRAKNFLRVKIGSEEGTS